MLAGWVLAVRRGKKPILLEPFGESQAFLSVRVSNPPWMRLAFGS